MTDTLEKPNRISFEQIENLKKQLTYEYVRTGEAGTICNVYLGTFRIADGYSACVDPANYSQELGEKYSKERADYNATNALWELMGFSLFKELNPEIFNINLVVND
jgi:hypothetical protein